MYFIILFNFRFVELQNNRITKSFILINIQMKQSLFKIRKLPANDGELKRLDDHLQASGIKGIPQNDQLKDKMSSLMTMFEQLMTCMKETKTEPSQKITANPDSTISQLQVRDRHSIINLPSTPDGVQKWMTDACIKAFSTSFHYYLTQQMTFEQAKVFCSQTILSNILRFTEQYKLTDKDLQKINKHVGEGVLEYLQNRYPLTQSNDVNKALARQVQETDHLDLMSNDFLYTFGIMFEYREDGNYNDLIMKVLNKAMEQIDGVSTFSQAILQKGQIMDEQISNYRDFELYTSELFEKTYDEEWMTAKNKFNEGQLKQSESKINRKINQAQKEKYAESVKQYTHYIIGRKISQNTPQYDEKEINSKHLTIKSPAILRILTKWCEELWEKFDKENYFTARSESVQLQNPEFVNPFFKWMKTAIDDKISKEKKHIIEFKKEIDSNSYNQQSFLLLKSLEDDGINFIPRMEKAYGKFATQMVKNMHTYTVIYLNRLIHGLLKVSQQFFQTQVDKSWEQWPAPPNLMTFKIGDLLRCKCSSKEKEIVKIFKEIKYISNTHPEKLKIVRIKNRLKQGTNDILINVKFNNLLICEIQLQVINKSKSKFINCSNSFSHYIYEMRRSIFGPISELCNIWNNFDPRVQKIKTILKKEETKTKKCQIAAKCQGQKEHNFQKFGLSFECSSCNNIYYHNNYIITNKKCQQCGLYKCVRCQISELDPEALKNIIFSANNKHLKQHCTKRVETIPSYGACIKIQSTTVNVQLFRYMKIQAKYWLLGITNNHIYEVQKVSSTKQISNFLQSYCIFQVNNRQLIPIQEKKAKHFTVEQYIKESYRQEKQVLILTQIRFQIPQMCQLMKIDGGYEKGKHKIKRLQFASNYLNDISYFSIYQNLTAINLDYNNFNNISQLTQFKHLEKLQMRENNKLVAIGEQLCQLSKLQQIKMSKCAIKTLPIQIGKLQALKIIQVNQNSIQLIPDSLCTIKKLKQIDMSQNKIKVIPESIGQMIDLTKLQLSKNSIMDIPITIFQLSNLINLSLSYNSIATFPQGIKNCTKLEKIELNNNKIQNIPMDLTEIQTLKVLALNNNCIKSISNNFGKCKNLQSLTLDNNQIQNLPQSLQTCGNLQTLSLFKNNFKILPDWLSKFKKLSSKINLSQLKLDCLPKCLINMPFLTSIDLSNNLITEIPNDIAKLTELQHLDFNKNKIIALNDALVHLKKLKKLNLNHNSIRELPEYVKDIQSLKNKIKKIDQYFSENPITFIEDIVLSFQGNERYFRKSQLTSMPILKIQNKLVITIMDFSDNKIKQIPREIKQFVNLKLLNLRKNQIQMIPAELAQLKTIKPGDLDLSENPIKVVECREYVLQFGSVWTKQIVTQKKQINLQKDKNQGQTEYLEGLEDSGDSESYEQTILQAQS